MPRRGVTSGHQGGNIGSVHTIALAAASSGAGGIGDGVGVAVFIIGTWWVSVHGKGGAAFRLIAWMMLPLVLWLLVAVHDPAQAGQMASGAASGVSVDISAASRLVANL
jgi:hypothetical protein